MWQYIGYGEYILGRKVGIKTNLFEDAADIFSWTVGEGNNVQQRLLIIAIGIAADAVAAATFVV